MQWNVGNVGKATFYRGPSFWQVVLPEYCVPSLRAPEGQRDCISVSDKAWTWLQRFSAEVWMPLALPYVQIHTYWYVYICICVRSSVVSEFLRPFGLCNLPGSSVHGILQTRVLEWVAIPFQGSFLTQGSNLGLLYYRQILYHLSHQGSPPTHQKYQDMRYELRKNSPEFFPLLI